MHPKYNQKNNSRNQDIVKVSANGLVTFDKLELAATIEIEVFLEKMTEVTQLDAIQKLTYKKKSIS